MMFKSGHIAIAVISGNIALGCIFGVINYALIPFLSSLTGSISFSGALLFVGMGIAAFLSPFVGMLSDIRWDRFRVILILLGVSGLACLTLSVCTGLCSYTSAVALVVAGFLLPPIYSAAVADYSITSHKATAFAVTISVTTAASLLSSVLIRQTYEKNVLHTFRFLALAIYGFSFPVCLLVGKSQQVKEHKAARTTMQCILCSKYLISFFVAQGMVWFAVGGVLPYITSFLNNMTGMPYGQAAWWGGILTALTAGGALLWGAARKALPERWAYSLIYVLVALGLGFTGVGPAFFSTNKYFVLIILANVHMYIGLFYAAGPTLLSSLIEADYHGRAFGINYVFSTAFQAAGVYAFGVIAETLGYRWLFVVAGIAALLGSFLLQYVLVKRAGNKKLPTLNFYQ